MEKIIITILISFLVNQVGFAQNTAPKQSLDSLMKEMQMVTEDEKAQLMARLIMIDEKVKKGELNVNDALDIKLLETDVTNLRIKRRMASYEQQMKDLINARLSGDEMTFELDKETYTNAEITIQESPKVEKVYGDRYMSEINSNAPSNQSNDESKSSETRIYKESRYIDQVVFAFGYNTLLDDGNTSDFSNTQINITQSRNYEFGLAWKYRIISNSNLLMLRYGVSYYRTHLSPRYEQIFQRDGNFTNLVTPLDDVAYSKFTNNYFIAPIHLEFDFSQRYMSRRSGKIYMRSQRGLRLGVGMYVGILASSTRQNIVYSENSRLSESKLKGDYNVSQFLYGTEANIGFREFSIRVKYDLSDLFANNPNRQNVASIGMRWDLK